MPTMRIAERQKANVWKARGSGPRRGDGRRRGKESPRRRDRAARAIPFGRAIATLGLILLSGCASPAPAAGPTPASPDTPMATMVAPAPVPDEAVVQADVTAVAVKGQAGAYTFEVTVRSPDKGCAQYADWWEVVSPDGELVFRRVLLHSHTDEQPFTRAGGPVNLRPDETAIVRAHMDTTGYVGKAMQGTVSGGFGETTLSRKFAANLEALDPQPPGCAF